MGGLGGVPTKGPESVSKAVQQELLKMGHEKLRPRREMMHEGPLPMDHRLVEIATHAYYLFGEATEVANEVGQTSDVGILANNLLRAAKEGYKSAIDTGASAGYLSKFTTRT